jgi:membrane protein implicated in regulation of membrane protease activity
MDGQAEPGKLDCTRPIFSLGEYKLSMVLCKIWFQLVMLVIYRIAARYLHNNFLNRKKGREEEVMSLLRVLEGRTKKESARLFYEILVCPTCL